MTDPVWGASNLTSLRQRLRDCCLSSLEHLYLENAGILARGRKWDGSDFSVTGPSARDTANVLIALYALRSRGTDSPLDPDRILRRCVDDHLDGCNYADVALLLWADSLGGGAHAERLWHELQARLRPKASDTMLLSWTLSGVCEYIKSGGDRRSRELAAGLYDRIVRNQSSRSGLFRASDARHGLLRRHKTTASISSQAFAMQALAQYSEALGDRRSAGPALACAERLRAVQGEQGEWWWSYDVGTGRVVERYPVYTVNQDGAMLSALYLTARAAGSGGFEDACNLGLRWVFGSNALGQTMLDERRALILRGIQAEGKGFGVIREMRTYHPGRCLYALAVTETI